jgi:hypothetical protein
VNARATPGDDERNARPPPPRGMLRSLCVECSHVKIVTSEKGSTFYLCQLARTDPRFPKYPPQPVVACSGFAR